MTKHRDKTTAQRKSTVCRYIPDEDYADRHARRFGIARKHFESLKNWCDGHNIHLQIYNGGHHWKFSTTTWTAEWWPSSAKLVFDREYKKGIHVHGYDQVIELLVNRGLEAKKEAE